MIFKPILVETLTKGWFTMSKSLKKAIKFLLKYPQGWHSYATDKKTVSVICSLVNLKIAEVSNVSNQFRLKSPAHAKQFLGIV